MNIGKGWGLAAAVLIFGTAPVISQYVPYIGPRGEVIQPMVIMCASDARKALPCGGPKSPMMMLAMPFVRSGNGDPFIFEGITTTPKQFAVSRPADATSYRFVNPCNVDVRIRKVASLTETVTPRTGTRFMARSSETLGTSEPKFISVVATAAPTGDCSPEIQWGNGG